VAENSANANGNRSGSGGGAKPDSTPEDGEEQPDPAAPSPLSYEQARDELADVVRRLEAGGLTLEESLGLWERGERLAGICEEWLEGARARLAAAMSERTGAGEDEAPF
jgi:exodeoxyribonuclease VII small subunit